MARVKAPSLRTQQAAQTRHRILDAAALEFEQRGYAGARIDGIAAAAGVAVPTVYKVFTNKVNLLVGALHQAMAGDDAAVIEEQVWFTEQLDEPDPERQLRLVARNARRIYERAGRLLDVLRAAAPLDPELLEAWETIAERRLDRGRATARSLSAKAKGRLHLSPDETATTLWALTDPQLFATYASGGRTADDYEAWLGDLLCRSLID
jgi:AcrR family transcriptional regulator